MHARLPYKLIGLLALATAQFAAAQAPTPQPTPDQPGIFTRATNGARRLVEDFNKKRTARDEMYQRRLSAECDLTRDQVKALDDAELEIPKQLTDELRSCFQMGK